MLSVARRVLSSLFPGPSSLHPPRVSSPVLISRAAPRLGPPPSPSAWSVPAFATHPQPRAAAVLAPNLLSPTVYTRRISSLGFLWLPCDLPCSNRTFAASFFLAPGLAPSDDKHLGASAWTLPARPPKKIPHPFVPARAPSETAPIAAVKRVAACQRSAVHPPPLALRGMPSRIETLALP